MKQHYSLFEVFGVEMEYMIVDRVTLNVLPLADKLFELVEGKVVSETEQGTLAWCNELVNHVVELKTNGPATSLENLAVHFQADVQRINDLLEKFGACLMPTAMHPWMDPYKETVLWKHEYNQIYETFNSIFDCRGHGWANLQSTHLNLPFNGDEEFGKLHAAIRAVLPLLPVLTASSPIMDGKVTGIVDSRLHVYRSNARRVPSVSGSVIPEPYYTESDYRKKLLQKIYDDIAPFDQHGVLQDEWLNARGAIARFDRNAIEIRVLDIQEHPGVDIAVLQMIVTLLRAIIYEKWDDLNSVKELQTQELSEILFGVIKDGGASRIDNIAFLKTFGISKPMYAKDCWSWIVDQLFDTTPMLPSRASSKHPKSIISMIIDKGNLSQRILRRSGKHPDMHKLRDIYGELVICLQDGTMFE